MKGPPSSPNQPRISVQMTDKDVIEKVANLFGMKYIHYTRQNPKYKECYGVLFRGKYAVELMKQLYPFMGERRKAQIDAALESWQYVAPGDNSRKLSRPDVESIRESIAKVSVAELARKFNVSRATVRRVRDYKSHKKA